MLDRLGGGWLVVHAVPVGKAGSDIDHLVIGPAGVFTINAKYHEGMKVWVASKRVLVNGQRTDHLRNAVFEASRVSILPSHRLADPGDAGRRDRRRTQHHHPRTPHRNDRALIDPARPLAPAPSAAAHRRPGKTSDDGRTRSGHVGRSSTSNRGPARVRRAPRNRHLREATTPNMGAPLPVRSLRDLGYRTSYPAALRTSPLGRGPRMTVRRSKSSSHPVPLGSASCGGSGCSCRGRRGRLAGGMRARIDDRCTPSATPTVDSQVTFVSVVDGDTIETSAGTVRIIGIDAPETGSAGTRKHRRSSHPSSAPATRPC